MLAPSKTALEAQGNPCYTLTFSHVLSSYAIFRLIAFVDYQMFANKAQALLDKVDPKDSV